MLSDQAVKSVFISLIFHFNYYYINQPFIINVKYISFV